MGYSHFAEHLLTNNNSPYEDVHMWKRLLLVTAVSAAMSSMAMAAPLTVGFSQVGSESGWRAAETNVAKSEAQKRGITLKIADGQQKQENQIKAVRSFIAQGVDAIFIAPVVATGWEPVLKEAKDAEIPVFLLDRSIDVKDKSLYMTTVTANNVLEGQLIGDWLVKQVDGKPCNVVELQGTVGASVAIDRKTLLRPSLKRQTSRLSALSPATLPAVKVKRSWRASLRLKTTARTSAWFTPTTMTW
jgi:simple sugar transport system substrate-binding protein